MTIAHGSFGSCRDTSPFPGSPYPPPQHIFRGPCSGQGAATHPFSALDDSTTAVRAGAASAATPYGSFLGSWRLTRPPFQPLTGYPCIGGVSVSPPPSLNCWMVPADLRDGGHPPNACPQVAPARSKTRAHPGLCHGIRCCRSRDLPPRARCSVLPP